MKFRTAPLPPSARGSRTRKAVAALTLCVVASLSLGAAAAQAAPCTDCPMDEGGAGGEFLGSTSTTSTATKIQSFKVYEGNTQVDTKMFAKDKERVRIWATERKIWAGLWFTGDNGPQGMIDRQATDPKFPLRPNASGTDRHGQIVRPYSLIASVDQQGLYQVGAEQTVTSVGGGNIVLRINDDVPNNGSKFEFGKYFEVTVEILPAL